jgi:hypothetical protein
MERPAPLARLSGEFDAFLFSSIGDNRNGIPLSVVSLLARRDLSHPAPSTQANTATAPIIPSHPATDALPRSAK